MLLRQLVTASIDDFYTVLSFEERLNYPYDEEEKEAIEAPPVYQHDPRTKRQLTQMLRESPYSDEDRQFMMGADRGPNSFMQRAWSNMRRSLGAVSKEPTRPFAKRNLFARLAPIPVFMITDWKGEPHFFPEETDYDPSFCPLFFDHADAEAAMYEMFVEDPIAFAPLEDDQLRLTALSLDEALIISSRHARQQVLEDVQRNERPIDLALDLVMETFWAFVPTMLQPKVIRQRWEEAQEDLLEEALSDDGDEEEGESSGDVESSLEKAAKHYMQNRAMKKFIPSSSRIGRWLWRRDEGKDEDEIFHELLTKYQKKEMGEYDDEYDDDEDLEQASEEAASAKDEKLPFGILPEDDDVTMYEFFPSTRQYIKGKLNKVKLATPDAFDVMPLYFVEGMQVRHGFRKVLPYYLSYDDCVKKYDEARERALRRGASPSEWPEKAPVQADSFRAVALAIDDGCSDYTIVPDSKQLEFIRRNVGKDQLARIYPTSQD